MEPVPMDDFERLVGDALDAMRGDLASRMDNVVVCVEVSHPDEDLLGLYEGFRSLSTGYTVPWSYRTR
ncbi:MAG: hypothetical protein M5U19_12610 [Microthrixaceae bacterium]|nr:hypothetical protein [Microthrixaceae bacterium]